MLLTMALTLLWLLLLGLLCSAGVWALTRGHRPAPRHRAE